jgi:hypothetical protein
MTGSDWLARLCDTASATVLALEQQAKGVFNIVDDEPAPARTQLRAALPLVAPGL